MKEGVIRYYLGFLPPKNIYSILDLGCGASAPYSGILRRRCSKLVCADIQESPKVDVILDVTKPLPFEDNEFDWVWATELIEHLPQDKQQFAVDEIKRVGRNATITFPLPRHPSFSKDPTHIEVKISYEDFKVTETKTGRVILILNKLPPRYVNHPTVDQFLEVRRKASV